MMVMMIASTPSLNASSRFFSIPRTTARPAGEVNRAGVPWVGVAVMRVAIWSLIVPWLALDRTASQMTNSYFDPQSGSFIITQQFIVRHPPRCESAGRPARADGSLVLASDRQGGWRGCEIYQIDNNAYTEERLGQVEQRRLVV
jgi:hypothetical protein